MITKNENYFEKRVSSKDSIIKNISIPNYIREGTGIELVRQHSRNIHSKYRNKISIVLSSCPQNEGIKLVKKHRATLKTPLTYSLWKPLGIRRETKLKN